MFFSWDLTWGHAQFEKRSRKPNVKCWNFTDDERRKRKNKYTRLGLKCYCWYCWIAFNYAFLFSSWNVLFTQHFVAWFGFFKGGDRENLLMTPLGQLKFEGSVFGRKNEMSYYWWNEWKQSVYVTVLAFATIEDVNICQSSSGGEKSFIQRTPIQLRHLKALFKLLLILLFYSKP